MRRWLLQDAKARFSELIRECENGPQVVSRHGKDEAVVVSIEEYKRLTGQKPNLVDFLRASPFYGEEISIQRDRSLPRDVKL